MADIPALPAVTAVELIDSYTLRLTFDDGTVGDVRFDTRDWFGVFEPLNDPAVFAQVYVDRQFGTIAWPGGLDMAPEPLYEQAAANPVARASPPVGTKTSRSAPR